MVAGGCLAVVLAVQFAVKRYVPAIYWLVVVLVSVFGTLVTDLLTDSLHVPLEASAAIFSIALGLTFAAWYAAERTLSIHSIFTRRREAFYWLAILFTFALGTATGDLVAEKLGVGYLVTGLLVIGVIVATAIAWRLGLDAVLAFWIAYVLTRPLGASLGDYLSQARADGGLGLGATVTSAVFLLLIMAVVGYLAVSGTDANTPTAPPTAQRSRHVGLQVVVVVVALLGAGLTGYYVRSYQGRCAGDGMGHGASATTAHELDLVDRDGQRDRRRSRTDPFVLTRRSRSDRSAARRDRSARSSVAPALGETRAQPRVTLSFEVPPSSSWVAPRDRIISDLVSMSRSLSWSCHSTSR